MPTLSLTDKKLQNLKRPKTGRIEYWDEGAPGLGLRVTAGTGTVSEGKLSIWFYLFRMKGDLKRYRLTLGTYPGLSLADARGAASAAFDKVKLGTNPSDKPVDPEQPPTFGDLAENWLNRYVEKNSRLATYKETKRILDAYALPIWGRKLAAEITPGDVHVLIHGIQKRGAGVQANRVLARLRALFNWATRNGPETEDPTKVHPYLSVSPAIGIDAPFQEEARERVLSDDEIRWFWKACNTAGWPFGPAAQLMLTTAQRRDEVGDIELPELDITHAKWTIPSQRAKNGRAHEVSLSPLALEVVKGAQATRAKLAETEDSKLKKSPYLFTTHGLRPASGYSRAKDRIAALMEAERRKELELPDDAPPVIPNWTLHDLRRTATTAMARLKIAPHIADAVLNHKSGSIRGVAAIYNRFEYLDERAAALATLGRFINSLLNPEAEDNVRDFREAANG